MTKEDILLPHPLSASLPSIEREHRRRNIYQREIETEGEK